MQNKSEVMDSLLSVASVGYRTAQLVAKEAEIHAYTRYRVCCLERHVIFLSILCAVSMATVFAMAAFLVYGRMV